jgi:hypothetical protein
MVVVVGVRQARLDERVGGQGAALGVAEEVIERGEVGGEIPGQPGGVDHPGRRETHPGVDVDPPRQARGFQPLENGLGVVVQGEVVIGDVDDEPRRRGRVVEGPVRERLRGHVAVPVVEGGETPRDRRDDRHLLGGVAGHDLRVFLIGGLTARLRGEHAYVVRDEPVHRRHRVRVARRVERSGHLLGHDAPVAGRVDDTEQLGINVREFLPRVGIRGVHVRRDPVGHDLAVRAVLGPLRDRVAQVLADPAPAARYHRGSAGAERRGET